MFLLNKQTNKKTFIVCETMFTANIVYCLLMHNWFQEHSASESFVDNNALSRLCGVTVKHCFAFALQLATKGHRISPKRIIYLHV